jgi:hypothetical protein
VGLPGALWGYLEPRERKSLIFLIVGIKCMIGDLGGQVEGLMPRSSRCSATTK